MAARDKADRAKRARLQSILDGNDPQYGFAVGLTIQVLIILSALSIALETLPNLPEWFRTLLWVEEAIIVALFSAEYAARIYAAPSRRRYIFSAFGIIDLMAILPSLLFLGLDLRAVRALRVLRLLSLFKLMRYQAALNRMVASSMKGGDGVAPWALKQTMQQRTSGKRERHEQRGRGPAVPSRHCLELPVDHRGGEHRGDRQEAAKQTKGAELGVEEHEAGPIDAHHEKGRDRKTSLPAEP